MIKNGGNTMGKIVSYTAEEMDKLESKTDWERVNNMTDDDIIFDEDSPELTDEMAAKGKLYTNGEYWNELNKKNITLKLDSKVISAYQSLGTDWENIINLALLEYAEAKSLFRQ